VVEGATSIEVTLNGEQKGRAADLIGSDPTNDIALIKIRDASDLPTATLGNSADLRVGDSVVAIGNALDLGTTPTVTTGIVSALDRSIDAPGESISGLIQTDAAINPGNSGGPLVDAQGRQVGVNTAIAGDAQNIGFALAIDKVKPVVETLRAGGGQNGTSSQPVTNGGFLGVSTQNAPGSAGATVGQVVSGSPADRAGLAPGDVVTAIDDDAVGTAQDLVTAVRQHRPGDTVSLTWTRDGERHTAKVELGSQ
jgi:putative serine protease PepD